MSPPPRLKPREEWSAEDHLRARQDPGHKPVNPEWERERDRVLEAAGLEPDEPTERPVSDMSADELEQLTPEDFLRRLQGSRNR